MSLLIASRVAVAYGMNTVLNGVDLRLEWGRRIGLVGRNGSGKTTLLRVLAGLQEPDSGQVTLREGVRVGYLRQEQMVEHGWTVYEEACDAFAPVLAMERRLAELQERMAQASQGELPEVLNEYALLHDRFEAMGGYGNLRDIPRVLQRLGFGETDLAKPTARLSGGEKTRLALARLLLSAPDILLLDEPTNHLDLEATEWLESFLSQFGGAILLVSHDRFMLETVVNQIAELDRGALTLYTGAFSAYWNQREERRKRQQELYERDQAEIARLEAFFEKWKNTPSRRSQAMMRRRQAERLRANATERPTTDLRSMRLKAQPAQRSAQVAAVFEQAGVAFGERTLFDNVSLTVYRGDRIGIVGPNGAGKSTLIRLLIGEENPTRGSARLGEQVVFGYFAQEASDLDHEETVLENLLNAADMTVQEARRYLGGFLFTGEDPFKLVRDLSGGEKNRLSLARLLARRPNLLILDEPTNHLDIAARHALTEMLRQYTGTLLLVSHDRYLLDQVTNRTLEVADGSVRLYDAPFSRYKALKETQQQREARAVQTRLRPETTERASVTAGMNSHELSRARRRVLQEIAKLEDRVSQTEDWVKRIEEMLSAPSPGDDLVALARDYERAQQELAQSLADWEEANARAEALGAIQ